MPSEQPNIAAHAHPVKTRQTDEQQQQREGGLFAVAAGFGESFGGFGDSAALGAAEFFARGLFAHVVPALGAAFAAFGSVEEEGADEEDEAEQRGDGGDGEPDPVEP